LKAVELNKWNYELSFVYKAHVKEYRMARLPRLPIADCPTHIIQRGNNRQACLFAEQDYKVYLDKLKEPVTKHHASVHAFFLMTHHVHLLMTAPSIVGISQVMQNLEGIMLGT
jgi:putative transposase